MPEGDQEEYATSTGSIVETFSQDRIAAAFSGSLYELLMLELYSFAPSRKALFRLVPGSDHLDVSWRDDPDAEADNASICWSGEVFVAVIPTANVGIRFLVFNEEGDMVHPIEVINPDPAFDPESYYPSEPFVLCPDGGPVVIDASLLETMVLGQMHFVRPDGTLEGRFVELDLPWFVNRGPAAICTTLGSECACLARDLVTGRNQVVFFSEDGVRYSETVPDVPGTSDAGEGQSLTAVGDDLAYVWSLYLDDGTKLRLAYMLYDRDGQILVQPTFHYTVGHSPYGIYAASSGSDVLALALAPGEPGTQEPIVFLIDADGTPLDSAPLTTDGLGPFGWEGEYGAAMFWEGDAYAVLWMGEMGIRYRRFLVVR